MKVDNCSLLSSIWHSKKNSNSTQFIELYLGVSKQTKPLQPIGQAAEFNIESKFQPLPTSASHLAVPPEGYSSARHEPQKSYFAWLRFGISNRLKKNLNSTQLMLQFWKPQNLYNSLARWQSSSLSPSLSPCRSSGNLSEGCSRRYSKVQRAKSMAKLLGPLCCCVLWLCLRGWDRLGRVTQGLA